MGTPDFAVPTLDILVQNGYDIAAVVTATDKLGGRGGKTLIESAVKKYAVEHNLLVLQPEKLRDEQFQNTLRSLNADLFIVVAFRMLPESVWQMPRIGTFNLHGSLLPKYRGAAPIHWAVINGETETGVTTFFLKHEIDTGDMLMQTRLPIHPNDTTGDVHDRMMLLGADTVLKTVQMIEAGNYTPQPQADIAATHAPKLHEDNTEVNFNQPTAAVYNFVRGLAPFPTAWTTLDSLKFKLYAAEPLLEAHSFTPGSVHTDNKNYFRIATTDGYLNLLEVQLEGRKRLDIRSFMNGYKPLV